MPGLLCPLKLTHYLEDNILKKDVKGIFRSFDLNCILQK